MDLKKKKTTATDLCIGQIITLLFNDGNHNQIKAWNQIKDSHPYWILDRIGLHWKHAFIWERWFKSHFMTYTKKMEPLWGSDCFAQPSVFLFFLLRPFKVSAGTAIKDRCDGLHSGDLWAQRQGGRWRTGGELGAKAGDLAVLADLCVWSKEFLTLPLLNFCQM